MGACCNGGKTAIDSLTELGGIKVTDFAVLESRWHDDSNLSVKPVFDMISHCYLDGSNDAIPYERFFSASSFRETVEFYKEKRQTSALYIACHGDENGLTPIFGDPISCIDLVTIAGADHYTETNKGRFSGLFFGSCSFLSEDNAVFLMDRIPELRWVAGYDKDVDWGESTMLDGLFMMEYVKQQLGKHDRMQRSDRGHYGNRIFDIVEKVFTDVLFKHSGLVIHLGFNVFMRKSMVSKVINAREIRNETIATLREMGMEEAVYSLLGLTFENKFR